MRTLLTTIILLTLVACNNKNNQKQKIKVIVNNSPSVNSLADSLINNEDSIPSFSYDNSIYNEYFSSVLKNFLKDSLKDWTVPDPKDWDNLWFQAYKNPNSLVNIVRGDFNCDTKPDYALLLSNKQKMISAWVIQSSQNGFCKIKLQDCGIFKDHIQIGLVLIEPGQLNYVDLENDSIKTMNLRCHAIQVEYFEKTATTYYWNKSKYKNVLTGD